MLSRANGAVIAASAAAGTATILNDDPAPSSASSWGDNTYGALGDPAVATQRIPHPLPINSDRDWAGTTTNGSSTLAIKTNGKLVAWGHNFDGELGDGTTTDRLAPEQIGTDTHWAQVSIGSICTLAVKTDGTLWAWGSNGNGQLGDGTGSTRTRRSKSAPTPTGRRVAVGPANTFAIKTDGTLWAWGDNSAGELGDGTTTTPRGTPEQIGGATDWARVSTTGARHARGEDRRHALGVGRQSLR